jgi:hypothetical protein
MTTNYIFHIQQLLEKTGHSKTQTQEEAQFLQTSLCLSPPPLWGMGGGGQNTISWFDRHQNIKGPTTNLLSEFQILKKIPRLIKMCMHELSSNRRDRGDF